jgi:hypothetical protein
MIIVCIVGIASNGCSGVKFYDDKDFKKESGIEFYAPKPYLLVEKHPAKDVAVKSTIIYLPDLTKPKYARLCGGAGTAELSLSLTNGIAQSFGVKYDGKLPETVESASSFAGSIASVAKELKSHEQSTTLIDNMQKAQPVLAKIISDVSAFIQEHRASMEELDVLDLKVVEAILEGVQRKLVRDIDRVQTKNVQQFVKQLNEARTRIDSIKVPGTANSSNGAQRLKDLAERIENVAIILEPSNSKAEASAELYEILITEVGTSLRRVEVR